jgi:hypothetical protein
MKKLLGAILLSTIVLAGVVNATMYKVYINRIGDNMYEDTYSQTVIQTQFCYEYVYYEDAILIDNSKLVFKNGKSCDVKRILR